MENLKKTPLVLSGDRRKWRLFACLTILGLALTSQIEMSAERAFTTQNDLIPVDFPDFYLGGKVALQRGAIPLYYPPADRSQGYTLFFQHPDDTSAWAQMYRANGFPQILRYMNTPFSAVMMAPLAMMPWQWAYLLWEIITIMMAAAAVFLTLRLLPSGRDWGLFALMFAAVCCFFPFRNNLVCGQINVAILFLWTLGVYLLERQRPVASGLCFALGTVLKVSPLVAVPLLALRRQWRWLAAYLAGVVAFTGVSVWQLGWRTHWIWLTVIYPSISSGVGNIVNRSLAGLVNVLLGPKYFASLATAVQWPVPHSLALLEKASSAAIGIGFIYWCWRRRKDGRGLTEELILLPLIYLLVAPFSWPHHFALAVLPLTYFWARAREATSAELAALYLGTLSLGTELPMYLAAFSPVRSPYLIIAAIALWPAATGAIIWAGVRISLRAQAHGVQAAG